ncbi:hypothetical protein ACLOJK_032411 [Asimina triloba]
MVKTLISNIHRGDERPERERYIYEYDATPRMKKNLRPFRFLLQYLLPKTFRGPRWSFLVKAGGDLFAGSSDTNLLVQWPLHGKMVGYILTVETLVQRRIWT